MFGELLVENDGIEFVLRSRVDGWIVLILGWYLKTNTEWLLKLVTVEMEAIVGDFEKEIWQIYFCYEK